MQFRVESESNYDGGSWEYINIDPSDIAGLCELEYACGKCVNGMIYTKVKRKKVATICSACGGKGKIFTTLGKQLHDFLMEHLPSIWAKLCEPK
jgi:hypothetical protein